MRAVRSRPWPSQSAHLEYAAFWGTLSPVDGNATRVVDGLPCAKITTFLEPEGTSSGVPQRLDENRKMSFQGCIPLGNGFLISPEVAAEWLRADPVNVEVLAPYLSGEDLNTEPDSIATRWAIDFNERDEQSARRYELPWAHVEAHVRPERMRKDAKRYPRMVHEWWKYWNSRPAMREAIAELDEVLAIAQVSKSLMPLRVSSHQVLSMMVIVIATDDYSQQAILSSSAHQQWVMKYGSGLRNDPRYTPSDVFETFPRPDPSAELDDIGRELDSVRREVMIRRGLGVTKLYNLVNNPAVVADRDSDVAVLRDLHQRLDDIVHRSYGWADVPSEHGFHEFRGVLRWTFGPVARQLVLDRLLEENHRRAAQEAASFGNAASRQRSAPNSIQNEGLF